MTDEELLHQVGDLATRIGHPVPAIERLDQPSQFSSVYLRPGPGGPTLVVHREVADEWPGAVRELAIAREFVASRLGHAGRMRLVQYAMIAAILGIGFVALITVRNWVEPLWLAIVLAIPLAYVPATVVFFAIMAGWNRWATRRIDRELLRVLGRDRVVEALELQAGERVPFRQWLRLGLAPQARQRLRWIG